MHFDSIHSSSRSTIVPNDGTRTRLGIVERIASEPNNVPRVLKGDTATPALNIDDAGLFMLLAGHSVAIIRPPGARAELLLLDAATDQ